MKHAALAAVVAVSACSSGSSPVPARTKTSDPRPAAQAAGRVVRTSFKSEALGVAKDMVIYLPADYDADLKKTWPVFYYLHGLRGDETNWVDHGKLAAVADEMRLGAIVVMPDGDNGFYSDTEVPIDYAKCLADGTGLFDPGQSHGKTCVRHMRYETYITKDLISWIDHTYRTNPTREARAIAGLSMGGFGALSLGMRHPDLFAAAASHSGLDALLYNGPFPYEPGKVTLETTPASWGGSLGSIGAWVRAIFGPDLENWRAHDPAFLAGKLAPGTLALYLDVGTEDEFALHNGAQYLHDLLLANKVDHAWYIGPGHHDFSFWIPRLPKSLAFLRDHTAK